MNPDIVYGPTIDSEKKNQMIDLLNVSKKDKLDWNIQELGLLNIV